MTIAQPALFFLLVSLLSAAPDGDGKDLARARAIGKRYGELRDAKEARRWRPRIAALIERWNKRGGPGAVEAISRFCRYADLDEYTVTALLSLGTEDATRTVHRLLEEPDPEASTPSGLHARCRRADLMLRLNEHSIVVPAAILAKVIAQDIHRQAMEAALRDLKRRTGPEAASAAISALEDAAPEAAIQRLRAPRREAPRREEVFVYLIAKNLRHSGDGPPESGLAEPGLLRDLEGPALPSPAGEEEKLSPEFVSGIHDRLVALASDARRSPWKRSVALRVLTVQESKRRIDAIEKILRDEETPPGLLREAVRVAIDLGDPRAGPWLAPVLRRWLETRDVDVDDLAGLIAAVFPLRIPGMESHLLAAAGSRVDLVRAAAIQSLPILGEEAAKDRIAKALNDPRWRIRHAAIVACGRLRSAAAVDLLISRMSAEKGRLRVPLLRALYTLTGVKMEYVPADWKKWWEPVRATFRPPAGDAEAVGRTAVAFPDFTRTTHFGIEVFSNRLCFVADTSGSMSAELEYDGEKRTRVEVVVDQLLELLDAMNATTSFNIFFFASEYTKLFPRLAPKNRTNVQVAKSFVRAARAHGTTNLSKPLADALRDPSVDTIFVISDGRPDTAPDEILAMVARLNRKRGVQINAIAIGEDSEFLRKLASRNLGEYRHYE